MRKYFYQFFIELSNKPAVSKILKKFTTSKFSRYLIPSYAKVYQIAQDEMKNNLAEFETLHELFTRKLKQEARPIDQNNNSVISPVDGVVVDVGKLTDKKLHVKGQDYPMEKIIGQADEHKPYENGDYVVVYLSPRHYHRIHSPVTGLIDKQWERGSSSYPVNQLGLRYGKQPLAENYRMITEIKTEISRMLVIKVGAMFINSIVLTHQHESVEKGEEIAYFSFGSTVILMFPKGVFTPVKALKNQEVKMGEAIGHLNKVP